MSGVRRAPDGRSVPRVAPLLTRSGMQNSGIGCLRPKIAALSRAGCSGSPRRKVAGWIAPPEIGINNTPLDYEHVRLN